MRKILPVSAALASLAVAGCVYPRPSHVAALNALVGKSETDLVRAEGVPTRTYQTGGSKFMAFSMSHVESVPGDYYGWGGWGRWGGGWGAWGYPEVIERDCTTTFELKAGIVQGWTLRGNAC